MKFFLGILIFLFVHSSLAMDCKARYKTDWQNFESRSELSLSCKDKGMKIYKEIYSQYMSHCEQSMLQIMADKSCDGEIALREDVGLNSGVRAQKAKVYSEVQKNRKRLKGQRETCASQIKSAVNQCSNLREQSFEYLRNSWPSSCAQERNLASKELRALTSSHVAELSCEVLKRAYNSRKAEARLQSNEVQNNRESQIVKGSTDSDSQ